jgi:DNA-directed RNA polymerase specialized sigma24 family protein
VNLTDLSPTSATEDGALTVDFPGQDPSPLEHMIRQEAGLEFKRIVDLVRRRLHRRDPTEREIFNLALEGKSNQEVIEELGCSLTAVKRCRRFVADLIRRMVTEENPGGSNP